jgi:thiol:disulfide interchange protein DsbD
MEKFKMLMAFPMLATAVWLYDFTAPAFGKSGSLWLGLFLVILAMAGWIYGEFVQRGRKRTGLALAFCVGLLAFGYGYILERQLDWRHPHRKLADGDLRESADGIAWQPWNKAAVKAAQAEGKPVLVDFTAVWCLICQANKASSLEIASVRAKIKELGVVPLLADNTDLDPLIAKELANHGRAGVPLVLVYPGKAGAYPEILPTVLTPRIVLAALDRAAKASR